MDKKPEQPQKPGPRPEKPGPRPDKNPKRSTADCPSCGHALNRCACEVPAPVFPKNFTPTIAAGLARPDPGSVPPKMETPLPAEPPPIKELLANARRQNAAGKKLCGTCKLRKMQTWECLAPKDAAVARGGFLHRNGKILITTLARTGERADQILARMMADILNLGGKDGLD